MKKFKIGIIVIIFFLAAVGVIENRVNLSLVDNENSEVIINAIEEYGNLINIKGYQICQKTSAESIKCTLEVDESEKYSFYQDYVTLNIKPELQRINMVFDKIANPIDESYFLSSYIITYKSKELMTFDPILGVKIKDDIFYPFLSNFTSDATFEFVPRNDMTTVCVTMYNNSIFKKVNIDSYYTNFKDEKGKRGETGLLLMSKNSLNQTVYNVKNNGQGVSNDYCNIVIHKNKIISYEMVIERIEADGTLYTFYHEFDYDDK